MIPKVNRGSAAPHSRDTQSSCTPHPPTHREMQVNGHSGPRGILPSQSTFRTWRENFQPTEKASALIEKYEDPSTQCSVWSFRVACLPLRHFVSVLSPYPSGS